jgi:hypothetical protein
MPTAGSTKDVTEEQFLMAFFGSSPLASLFRDLLLRVCSGLEISQADVWTMFVRVLILRTHYHASRDLANRSGVRLEAGDEVVQGQEPMPGVVTGLTATYNRYLWLAAKYSRRFILAPVASQSLMQSK